MGKESLLHVYGQESPHDDAWVVGNKEGLLVLKRAIEQALNTTHGDGEACDAQGNPFDVRVLFITDPPESPAWQQAAMPYTAEGFVEKRPEALWPVSIAPTQRFEPVTATKKKKTKMPKRKSKRPQVPKPTPIPPSPKPPFKSCPSPTLTKPIPAPR